MKTAIADYLLPSAEEKKALWDTSVFVFDTNVLLNLYRYTRPTREALFAALVEMADRVWLPHQVAEEYAKHRHEIIFETEEKYKTIGKQASDFVDAIQNELRLKRDDSALSALKDLVFRWIEEQRTQNILAKSASEDPIISQLLSIFDGKVGPAFSLEELNAIYTEGKERYEKQTPPGYCDAKKEKDNPNHNAYGDLIVWKQILAYH